MNPHASASRSGHRLCHAGIVSLTVSLCTGLSGCDEGVLAPRGPVGRAEHLLLADATVVMLAVVIPVIVTTLVFAWWFREGNRRARYRPRWDYSGRIEFVVWSIPTLVILFLGGMAWIGSHQLHPPKPLASDTPVLEVQVVSLDWKWLFIYPQEGVASVSQLVIPTQRPVRFTITSASVMNSFFIPQLGSQIYAMPGMTTQLNLLAEQPGTYRGLSAQFSGHGFSDMHFSTLAVPPQDYARWVEAARVSADTLDLRTYADIAKPGKAGPPKTFAAVSPTLFELIVSGRCRTTPATEI